MLRRIYEKIIFYNTKLPFLLSWSCTDSTTEQTIRMVPAVSSGGKTKRKLNYLPCKQKTLQSHAKVPFQN